MKITEVDSIPMTELEQKIVAAGFAGIAAQRQRLADRGVLDKDGKLVNKELPPDMREDSETSV